MKSRRWFVFSFALLCACVASQALAQSPSALYTWDNTGNAMPNAENWAKNFGTNTVILDNAVPGALRIIEIGGAGADVAISDGANRVRESSTASSGGTDVTGLDYIEFDIGHSGAGIIQIQPFVQASTSFTYVSLVPFINIPPGPVATYQFPLSGLTPAQAVYLRTIGFNAFNHAGVGDVVWTLEEVRAGGTPLKQRTLITHDGTVEGGLQGAIVNFDNAAVQGNNGGQNQTGLSWDAANNALQWTDVGGQQGAALSWGNGTAWLGNTFNNRATDLSNYQKVKIAISATDPNNGGGTVGLNAFFQKNNFAFQNPEGGAGRNLPIDGKFHVLEWSLAGMPFMNVVDLTGINLFGHDQNLVMRVDWIRFSVPEPASLTLLGFAAIGFAGMTGRKRRQVRT